jgi:hypothetical protein
MNPQLAFIENGTDPGTVGEDCRCCGASLHLSSMAMMAMPMAMMPMPMAMMVPSMMVFVIVIAWLAIRIDIARIVIVIGWWHDDHTRDTDVNIDRGPRRDGPYADRQQREHGGDDDSCHADLLR